MGDFVTRRYEFSRVGGGGFRQVLRYKIAIKTQKNAKKGKITHKKSSENN